MTDITVSAFIGPETVPLQVGTEKGFFAARGLTVRCEPTLSSVAQMVGLIEGRYDVASTAIDNVIAYVEGQGAAPAGHPADLVAFLGSATDPRRLVAGPGVTDFAALAGRRIAVDAVGTGFSFLLRQTLEDQGLDPADYTLVPVGNLAARWNAIRTGDCAAGLLSTEYAEMAGAEGCRVLEAVPDPWERYQGAVYTADRRWLRRDPAAVEGFVHGVLDAVDWTLDPANAVELPGLVMRHLPDLTAAAAGRAAATLQSPRSVLKRGMPIDIDGIDVVLALRRKYGAPAAALGDPQRYLDLACYEKAMAGRR